MPTSKAYILQGRLLNGTYNTAGSFETYLTAAADNLATFNDLLTDRAACQALFSVDNAYDAILGSNTAWLAIVSSSIALSSLAANNRAVKKLCTNGAHLASLFAYGHSDRFQPWLQNPQAYAYLQDQVNASGSKLKRQIFTASGTWTCPASCLAFSMALVGGGAAGRTSSSGGQGGGGGALNSYNASTMPTTNQTVTVGNGGTGTGAGSDTSVGTYCTAKGAASGTGGTSTGANHDVTGHLYITDYDLLNAVFQLLRVHVPGGNGGTNGADLALGNPGEDGLPYTGGAPGYYDGTTAVGGACGRRYCGGGGGGGNGGSSTFISGKDARSIDYGVGGGGGPGGSGTNSGGSGDGGSGLAVIYWVEA